MPPRVQHDSKAKSDPWMHFPLILFSFEYGAELVVVVLHVEIFCFQSSANCFYYSVSY